MSLSALKSTLIVSKQLYDFIEAQQQWDDREFVTLNELLAQREVVMEAIRRPTTDEEQKIATMILQLSKVIDDRLHQLLQQFGQQLRKFETSKQSQKAYNQLYENHYGDGVFFDEKN